MLGRYPVRLPRPADLVPPSLALRLLREAGPRARVTGLAPRRVAGIAAAGLRVIPGDPASTVARIDIWADPASGLPLQVEVFGRGSGQPALETQFLQVSSWHPVPAVLGFKNPASLKFLAALDSSDSDDSGEDDWFVG